MSDKLIIQAAMDQVGQKLGKLQGQLFVAESRSEALRAQIQRLDTVYQNLLTQSQTKAPPKTVPALTEEETIHILRDLPTLDPASEAVCFDVANLLRSQGYPANRKERDFAIARMESHAWKQGEAIALAQKVVQFLRS